MEGLLDSGAFTMNSGDRNMTDLGTQYRFPDTSDQKAFGAAALNHVSSYPGLGEVLGAISEGRIPKATANTAAFCRHWFEDQAHLFSKCTGLTAHLRTVGRSDRGLVAPNALSEQALMGDRQVLAIQHAPEGGSYTNAFFEIRKEDTSFNELPFITTWNEALAYMALGAETN